jgi:hypothetical protein
MPIVELAAFIEDSMLRMDRLADSCSATYIDRWDGSFSKSAPIEK